MRVCCHVFLLLAAIPAHAAGDELLTVLQTTGEQRDGLPVVRPHPRAAEYRAGLEKGFSGRLLRLYRELQTARTGRAESAVLCLTRNEGGFPRRGYLLDGQERREAWYVDLKEGGQLLHGRFGAMDQIFPHELFHVILRQLTGEPGPGGSNQTHALGVRTDPLVAFDEGFAEHCQILAVDDAGGDPATRKLATDPYFRERARAAMSAYARELTTPWPFAWRWRISFPLWFSQYEQALRYWGVKENSYARPSRAGSELTARGPSAAWKAYLAENVLPGDSGEPWTPVRRLMANEGVIAHFAWRMTQAPALAAHYDGTLEGYYRALFQVLEKHQPKNVAGLIGAWKKTFPGDAIVLEEVVRESFGASVPARSQEIWLANPSFLTGTTLFDQFRAAPRVHTFDLNAATRNELLGVPGVSPELAGNLERAVPLERLEDLQHVPAMTPAVYASFREMESRMMKLRAAEDEDGAIGSLKTILMAAARRLLAMVLGAGLLASCVDRALRHSPWWRAILNGLAAAMLAIPLAWLPGIPLWMAAAVPLVLFALPAAVWRGVRDHSLGAAARAAGVWIAMLLPVVAASWPFP